MRDDDPYRTQLVLFDWGDTVMRNFPSFSGPMHAWPKVEEIPGVRTAIETLRPVFRIGLATNAHDSDETDIRRALGRCGLSDAFDSVFCYRQVGHRKSERMFYLKILETLEIDASDAFMVGDSLEGDVHAANSAGISAVWFNPGSLESSSGENHRTIHRFEDLVAALEELGARLP
jgi:HAD superfamily hydrolase (TIGR01509 family)